MRRVLTGQGRRVGPDIAAAPAPDSSDPGSVWISV